MEHEVALVGDTSERTFHGDFVAHVLSQDVIAKDATFGELFAGRVALDDEIDTAFLVQRRDWSVGSCDELATLLISGLENLDVLAGWQATDPLRVGELGLKLPSVVAELLLLRNLQLKLVVLVLGHQVKECLAALREAVELFRVLHCVDHPRSF